MFRSFIAVLAGVLIWTVFWLAGIAAIGAMFPQHIQAGEPLTHNGILLLILVFSVVLSVLAGYITGRMAGRRPVLYAFWLGLVQLGLGIYFQSLAWELMPLWYHASFLALLIPGNLAGGGLAIRAG